MWPSCEQQHVQRRSKAKNAQEAHEAVRPTDAQRHPAALPAAEARLRRLYDLIWRRTLASQMAAARIRQVLQCRKPGD
jgi:DNA topoisomerase I